MRLNEGLEKIGISCFERSFIERLVIPASVKHIGCRAFSRCLKLTKIVFAENSQLESAGEISFDNAVTVYVNTGMEFDIEANLANATVVRLPQPSEV